MLPVCARLGAGAPARNAIPPGHCALLGEGALCRTSSVSSGDVKPDLLVARIRRGDITNVDFDDLVRLVEALGFREVSSRGSHRGFAHPDVPELVNLQIERGQYD